MQIVSASKVNPKFQAKFGQSDVVQQSIAVAIEKFDDFRGHSEGELFTWVKQILRNEMLQQQRALLSDKRNMFREQPINVETQSGNYQLGVTDPQHTPKTNALRKEQAKAVEAAINKLPVDYRDVIRLRNQEQHSFAEIGRQMDRSENAVTKLWYRALIQLRSELEDDDDGC